ncbi:hypothetical protein HY024_02080 [Candidatus Curtissbacteria bacterium]|nr:hypothetical protein [Candidatus Curtissbacteria bacterium]
MKKLKFAAGFTLIEMLLYMGLSAIFLVSITQIFVLIAGIRLDSESTSGVQMDGQYLLSRVAYDVSRSGSITAPLAGQSGTTLTTNLFTYTYDLSSGNLQITEAGNTDNLNSTNSKVSNLTFTHLDPAPKDTVQVKFTLTSVGTSQKGPETRTFQTTVGLK